MSLKQEQELQEMKQNDKAPKPLEHKNEMTWIQVVFSTRKKHVHVRLEA